MKRWRLSGTGNHPGHILSPSGKRPRWVEWTLWCSRGRMVCAQGSTGWARFWSLRPWLTEVLACQHEQEVKAQWCSEGCGWEYLESTYYIFFCPKATRCKWTQQVKAKTDNSFFFYNLVWLTSLTLNWPTGGLFEVQGGLSGKSSSEINSTETWDTDWVSSFTGGLYQREGTFS